MSRDDEAPEHFGLLSQRSLSPRRALWTLAGISAVLGVLAVTLVFAGTSAPADSAIAALPRGAFSSFGFSRNDHLAALPNSLLTAALTANFGIFILYGLSCFLCMAAWHKRPGRNLVVHLLVPAFGLAASLACMSAYFVGPIFGLGTFREPLLALAISAAWGIYGGIYFLRSAKKKGTPVLLTRRDVRAFDPRGELQSESRSESPSQSRSESPSQSRGELPSMMGE